MIFAGGVSENSINSTVKSLSEKRAKQLKEILTPHIDRPVSHNLPADGGANIDPYTEEEAEQWIEEYNKAMSEVPEEADS